MKCLAPLRIFEPDFRFFQPLYTLAGNVGQMPIRMGDTLTENTKIWFENL